MAFQRVLQLAATYSLLLLGSRSEGERTGSQQNHDHQRRMTSSRSGHLAGKLKVKALVAVMVRVRRLQCSAFALSAACMGLPLYLQWHL